MKILTSTQNSVSITKKRMEGPKSPEKKFVYVVGESGDVISIVSADDLTAEYVVIIVCTEYEFDISCMAVQLFNPFNKGEVVVDNIIPAQFPLPQGSRVQIVNIKGNVAAHARYNMNIETISLPTLERLTKYLNANVDRYEESDFVERIPQRETKRYEPIYAHFEGKVEEIPYLKEGFTKERLMIVARNYHKLQGRFILCDENQEPFPDNHVFRQGEKVHLKRVEPKKEPTKKNKSKKDDAKNNAAQYLSEPIYVKTSDEPLIFHGIRVTSNGISYEDALAYICGILNVSTEDHELQTKHKSFYKSERFFSGSQLELVKRK